jgi:hypothetical protein
MATKFTTPALIGTALVTAIALAPPAQSGTSGATETRFLAVDDGRIAYDDTGGNGPLILAIPGMGDLRSEYRLLRPALRRAGYRVVTMDVRGHGESSARWADYSAHAVGGDALALLAHLNAGPAVILGDSFAAGCDDRPIQGGYRSHRTAEPGPRPRRDGHPRSGLPGCHRGSSLARL